MSPADVEFWRIVLITASVSLTSGTMVVTAWAAARQARLAKAEDNRQKSLTAAEKELEAAEADLARLLEEERQQTALKDQEISDAIMEAYYHTFPEERPKPEPEPTPEKKAIAQMDEFTRQSMDAILQMQNEAEKLLLMKKQANLEAQKHRQEQAEQRLKDSIPKAKHVDVMTGSPAAIKARHAADITASAEHYMQYMKSQGYNSYDILQKANVLQKLEFMEKKRSVREQMKQNFKG